MAQAIQQRIGLRKRLVDRICCIPVRIFIGSFFPGDSRCLCRQLIGFPDTDALHSSQLLQCHPIRFHFGKPDLIHPFRHFQVLILIHAGSSLLQEILRTSSLSDTRRIKPSRILSAPNRHAPIVTKRPDRRMGNSRPRPQQQASHRRNWNRDLALFLDRNNGRVILFNDRMLDVQVANAVFQLRQLLQILHIGIIPFIFISPYIRGAYA